MWDDNRGQSLLLVQRRPPFHTLSVHGEPPEGEGTRVRGALRKNRRPDERGAALVEFALILPVFMMLVLGMFSGGLAYNQKLSLSGASREASRYGATLAGDPAGTCSTVGSNTWLTCIANNAIASATGELGASAPGRDVCVAYYTGTAWATLHIVGGGTPTFSPDAECYSDGLGTDRRLQVDLKRDGKIEILFGDIDLALRGRSSTRVEAE